MTERRTYTVVGAGAVGLLYGGRLAQAGHTVRWLTRSGVEQMRRDGIRLRDQSGVEVCLIQPSEVEVHTDPAAVPASDVVLVALKTTANADLGTIVGPAIHPGAAVALFQNGLGAEQQLRDQVPAVGPLVAGLCFVCAHRLAPGYVHHLDYGAVTLAQDGPGDDAAAAIEADLADAGFEASRLPDLAAARWRKLVWNIPFNGLCTVLDASTDELLADPGTRALVADLMDEVLAASVAVGAPVPAEFRDQMLATTDAMTSYAPSMKLDHDAGRPLEVAAIYDAAVAAARAAGAPMVRTEALGRMLWHLDRRRGR